MRPERNGRPAKAPKPGRPLSGRQEKTLQAKPERNLGVDALRCAAMYLIVCLHVMNRGGAVPAGTQTAGLLLYPLRILAASAVNMYALITGFVMLRGRFRPARIFELWLLILFWNVLIGAVGCLFDPDAMDGEFWVRYLFPFTQKAYWYFTAYVGVYAFSPIVNRGIRSLSRRQAIGLIWIMVLVFSLCSMLGYMGQGDPFSIGSGYSVLWLLALYVVGACVRHVGWLEKTPLWKLILALALVIALQTLVFWILQIKTLPKDVRSYSSKLLGYTHPFITAVSILMLLIFSRLRPGKKAGRVIAFLAPLTFGVYIIHVHHVIWMRLEGAFSPLLKLPAALLVPAVMGTALAIFLGCLAAEFLRDRLFRLLRVKQSADRLERALRRLFRKLVTEKNGKQHG